MSAAQAVGVRTPSTPHGYAVAGGAADTLTVYYPVLLPFVTAHTSPAQSSGTDSRVAPAPTDEATRKVEGLRDRLRDFLLSLPAQGQLEVTQLLNRELDRWEQWIERTGTWRAS